jgi:hypothetical protein
VAEAVSLLIVGAGPYGLAMAAYCRHMGVEHRLVGEPMAFWKRQMPRGMLLRSKCDWHLDPLEERTLEHYCRSRNLRFQSSDPIPLSLYLDYAQWFQDEYRIVADRRLVESLKHRGCARYPFEALLDDGDRVVAKNVVVATGFGACAHMPEELTRILPRDRVRHSQQCVDLAELDGKSRCTFPIATRLRLSAPLIGHGSTPSWTRCIASRVGIGAFRRPLRTPSFNICGPLGVYSLSHGSGLECRSPRSLFGQNQGW